MKRTQQNLLNRRRGVAMLLVIAAIALASVMGLAMLSSTSLQSQVTANSQKALSADCLAESGVNVAMYYLLNPSSAPSLNADGYWSGASNYSFGSDISGTVTITITRPATNTYDITAVGTNGSLSRTLQARVKVNSSSWSVEQAAGINDSVTFPAGSVISGNPTAVKTNGTATFATAATVTGAIIASSSNRTYTSIGAGAADVAPAYSSIKDYRTYTYNGQTYNAVEITSNSLNNVTYGATAGNPGGVYYYSGGHLKFQDDVVFNGSLILTDGKLTIDGEDNVITPKTGLPGLIIKDEMKIKDDAAELTVNGLFWLGKGVKSDTNSDDVRIVVNGAFLIADGDLDASKFKGDLVVTYDAAKVAVTDFCTTGGSASSVTVSSWTN